MGSTSSSRQHEIFRRVSGDFEDDDWSGKLIDPQGYLL